MYQLKEVRRNATPGAALQQNYHRGMIPLRFWFASAAN